MRTRGGGESVSVLSSCSVQTQMYVYIYFTRAVHTSLCCRNRMRAKIQQQIKWKYSFSTFTQWICLRTYKNHHRQPSTHCKQSHRFEGMSMSKDNAFGIVFILEKKYTYNTRMDEWRSGQKRHVKFSKGKLSWFIMKMHAYLTHTHAFTHWIISFDKQSPLPHNEKHMKQEDRAVRLSRFQLLYCVFALRLRNHKKNDKNIMKARTYPA